MLIATKRRVVLHAMSALLAVLVLALIGVSVGIPHIDLAVELAPLEPALVPVLLFVGQASLDDLVLGEEPLDEDAL